MIIHTYFLGERKIPSDALSMDFNKDRFLEAYLFFLDNVKESSKKNPISKDQYVNNHIFIVMDCTVMIDSSAVILLKCK